MNQKQKEERKQNIIQFCRQLFFHNLPMKLLSIVGGILVWVLIMNINDPYKTKNFLVQVQVVNEDALYSVHKVYEITEGNTAFVSVRGKRSIVDNLDTDDISATADLSELSSVNAVAIRATLRGKNSSDVTLECNQVMKLSIEDMDMKQVKLTVDTEGVPADGYMVGECTTRPSVIEVTGGSSVIDRITTVHVTINVNGASQDITKRVEPVAYDKRGNRVVSSTLSFSDEVIRVRAKLLQSKTIPIKLNVSGTPADGYEFIEANCLPEEIEIAGTAKQLEALSELVIPLDISGMRNTEEELEQEISVGEYLDANIVIPEEYQRIAVTITMERLIRKRIQIQTAGILINNVGKKFMANVYGGARYIEIIIEGRESVIDGLSESDFAPYVDCTGLKVGVHSLPVKLEKEDGYKLVRSDRLTVWISRKMFSAELETPSPETTEEPEEASALPE